MRSRSAIYAHEYKIMPIFTPSISLQTQLYSKYCVHRRNNPIIEIDLSRAFERLSGISTDEPCRAGHQN